MENILGVLSWLSANLGAISTAVLAFLAFASLVVKFTPTTKDDEAVAFAQKAVNWLVGFLSNFSTANKNGHVEVPIVDAAKVEALKAAKSIAVEIPSTPGESPK